MQALDDAALRHAIGKPTDERLWALAEGLRRGWGVDEVNLISHVDRWFLRKIDTLVDMECRLLRAAEAKGESEPLAALIADAFLLGFPSPALASLLGVPTPLWQAIARARGSNVRMATSIRKDLDSGTDFIDDPEGAQKTIERLTEENGGANGAMLTVGRMTAPHADTTPEEVAKLDYEYRAAVEIERQKVMPVFKMVDTCAGEFESRTPYYYGTFEQEDDAA